MQNWTQETNLVTDNTIRGTAAWCGDFQQEYDYDGELTGYMPSDATLNYYLKQRRCRGSHDNRPSLSSLLWMPLATLVKYQSERGLAQMRTAVISGRFPYVHFGSWSVASSCGWWSRSTWLGHKIALVTVGHNPTKLSCRGSSGSCPMRSREDL